MADAQGAAPIFPDAFAGKYRPRRLLASGGMGQVWIARNVSTCADVALKVQPVDASGHGGHEAKDRFRNEARLAARLAHRNIVRVHDLLEAPDGTLALVMELLRGEPLSEYADRVGPLSAPDAVGIVLPVLRALAHAHASGVVHRDVTPGNIFLAVDPDGHVTPKLVDFGIAKWIGAAHDDVVEPVRTLEGHVLGTPRYLAPERIRDSTAVEPRSDLFAVSVILYELISGTSPFAASSSAASLAAVLEREIDPDPRIDPRLWVEIRRAMSKRPYERHTSSLEMGHALGEAIGETEASLESRGLSAPPRVHAGDDLSVPDGEGGAGRTSNGANASRRPRARISPWIAAGAIVVLAVAAVLRAVEPSKADTRRPAAAAPAPAATILPSSDATAATGTHSAAAAPAPTPNLPPRPRPVRTDPMRPRPIATTPGF